LGTIGHFGGGGVGEGEAEDFGWGYAVEQQTKHPIGEEAGFSGTGIGGNKHGVFGVKDLGFIVCNCICYHFFKNLFEMSQKVNK
jgi:hypothetical protein